MYGVIRLFFIKEVDEGFNIVLFFCDLFSFYGLGRNISVSSIYLKYMKLIGSLYLKGLDSKNSRNKQPNTPLSGFPMGRPYFLFLEYVV